MKLVVGLGNPRPEYFETRHNAGFLTVGELQKIKLPKDMVVKKSDVFMNESGKFISGLIYRYEIEPEDLYVIHDDLDIPLGTFKIQFGKGPREHNGLKSVDEALGTDQYWHVRIGIENRSFGSEVSGKDYVLENFTEEERKILDKVAKEVAQKLPEIL